MNLTRMQLKIIVAVLSVVLTISVSVTVWALFFRDDDAAPVSPDYPPQGTEANQRPLESDEGEKLENPSGGGAINVTYGTGVTVDISAETVTLSYVNPGASNQNVAIMIVIPGTEELVIAKSDRITPGHSVETLSLEAFAKDRLAVGGYDGELVIRAYDPATGEKAMVDMRGKITITVVE